MKILFKKFGAITIFGIAMGFLEAAVVVYLREIIYPEGFCFPLKDIPSNLFLVELGRESATIIMLIAIGVIAGRNFTEKFCYFIYTFGIWDIFYYIWLKATLNWPPSLFTDDILFLIPVPWVGPVLAPVIVSMTMITFALLTVYSKEKGYIIEANRIDFLFLSLACIIIFISFIWDFPRIIAHEMPSSFHWELFSVGGLYGISGFYRIYRRKI
jgi:hypothetical protein